MTVQITAYSVYKIESKLQRRREHHLQLQLANLLRCVLQCVLPILRRQSTEITTSSSYHRCRTRSEWEGAGGNEQIRKNFYKQTFNRKLREKKTQNSTQMDDSKETSYFWSSREDQEGARRQSSCGCHSRSLYGPYVVIFVNAVWERVSRPPSVLKLFFTFFTSLLLPQSPNSVGKIKIAETGTFPKRAFFFPFPVKNLETSILNF